MVRVPRGDAGPMRRADARMVDLYWPRPRPHFEERLRGVSWGSGEPKRQGSAAPWDLEVLQHLVSWELKGFSLQCVMDTGHGSIQVWGAFGIQSEMGEVAVFMLQVLPAPARPFGMPPLPFQLSLLQERFSSAGDYSQRTSSARRGPDCLNYISVISF